MSRKKGDSAVLDAPVEPAADSKKAKKAKKAKAVEPVADEVVESLTGRKAKKEAKRLTREAKRTTKAAKKDAKGLKKQGKLGRKEASARAKELKAEAKALRREVAVEFGLSPADAALLDTVSDEAAMRSLAERLRPVADTRVGAVVPGEGGQSSPLPLNGDGLEAALRSKLGIG